jgi:hypothetical protein
VIERGTTRSTVEFEGRQYSLTRACDLERDGMGLEMDDIADGGRELVLYAFYSDADGRISLSAFREDLPLAMVEWFISRARELLPPVSE